MNYQSIPINTKLVIAACLILSFAGCATPTAPPKETAITRTGQDLTTLAAQAFQAYSDYKKGDKSYLWSINQGLTAYRTLVKTSADIKEVVKQFGDSKVDDATGKQRSLIDRLAMLFNSSAALPEVKAAAIAKAAEKVASK